MSQNGAREPVPLMKPLGYDSLLERMEERLQARAEAGLLAPEPEAPSAREPLCAECQDRGWIGDAPARRLCGCRQPGVLARAGTPTRYQRFTRCAWESAFQPWEQATKLAPLASWPTDDPADWLVLIWGEYGRRKTSLATALLGDAIARTGRKGLWLDVSDWVDAMEAGMDRNAEKSAAEVFARARDADLLLLDDLGAVRGGRAGKRAEQDWWTERIASLLRYRESWCRPTIATTNGRPEDLGRLDPSLIGRCAVRLSIEAQGRNYREVNR